MTMAQRQDARALGLALLRRIVALAGLVVLAPMLVAVGLAILIFDGPPVFFRQLRVGRGGKDFRLLKFRTMRVRCHVEEGRFDPGGPPRTTRLGRFLRKTKLDELPQLLNVLKGDMALVGPRPEVRHWVDAYPERWAGVLRVLPGMTDPASLVYRNEEDLLALSDNPELTYRQMVLPHKLDLYERYIERRTWRLDLRILYLTLVVVASGREIPTASVFGEDGDL